ITQLGHGCRTGSTSPEPLHVALWAGQSEYARRNDEFNGGTRELTGDVGGITRARQETGDLVASIFQDLYAACGIVRLYTVCSITRDLVRLNWRARLRSSRNCDSSAG